LPSPKPDVEFWAPLRFKQIAHCPDDEPFYREHVGANAQLTSKKRGLSEMQSSAKPLIRLHGKVDPHDVVIPAEGCTLEVARLVHDLIGNRRFLRLISAHRAHYFSLTSEEERSNLAYDLVQNIQEKAGGVFRNATCREVDGEPVVLKSKNAAEAIEYTRLRLEKGFADVMDNGRTQILSHILHRDNARDGDKLKDEKDDCNYCSRSSKVMKVQYLPRVGLIRGYLRWDNELNETSQLKLSELIEIEKTKALRKHNTRAMNLQDDPLLKLYGDNRNDGVSTSEGNNSKLSSDESLIGRPLSSPSAITTDSERSDSSFEKDVGQGGVSEDLAILCAF
jgi:hypothetical protein